MNVISMTRERERGLTCDSSFGKACAWPLWAADRSGPALCCCCSCCCCAAASDLRSCLHLSTPIITALVIKERPFKEQDRFDSNAQRSLRVAQTRRLQDRLDSPIGGESFRRVEDRRQLANFELGANGNLLSISRRAARDCRSLA